MAPLAFASDDAEGIEVKKFLSVTVPVSGSEGACQMESLKKVLGQLEASDVARHVGDEVFWSVEGVAVERSTVEQALLAEGLDADGILCAEVGHSTSFRRAVDRVNVSEASKSRAAAARSGSAEFNFIRFVSEDEKGVTFAVVRQMVVDVDDALGKIRKGRSLDLDVVDRVIFDKEADTVLSDINSEVSRHVSSMYDKLKDTFTSQDLLSSLRRAMDYFNAIPIRDHGGVYFVPNCYTDSIEALARVVETLGQSSMGVINLFGTLQSKRALSTAATNSLEAQVKDLKAKIDAFNGNSNSKVLSRRVEELKELRAKVGLYSDILGFTQDALLSGLAEAEATVIKSLAGE